MKNIGLIFETNFKIGGGHFWRCLNLAKVLRTKGRKFYFISNKLENNFKDILKKENFNFIKVKSLKSYSDLKFIIIKNKIKIFISDCYSFSSQNKKKIKKIVDTLVVVDDHINKKHFCDVFINNNFMTGSSKSKIRKLNPNTKLLLGTKFFIHNKNYYNLKNKKKIKKIKKIFAFFGTSDPTNETFKFIQAIKNFKKLKFQILIGKLNKNFKKIKKLCKSKNNIKIFYNLSNDKALKLMHSNDLSFGSGGINLTERLFVGLVSVAICTAKNQKRALIALSKRNIIHYLGESKSVNISMIKKCVESFTTSMKTFNKFKKKINKYYKNENTLNLISEVIK